MTEHSATPAWMNDGVCASVDPDLWYPETGVFAHAKRVCNGCPVKAECLEYALDNSERWGIWGGTSEHERRALLKARAA